MIQHTFFPCNRLKTEQLKSDTFFLFCRNFSATFVVFDIPCVVLPVQSNLTKMLVQPDHPSSSVKLRRKNRHSEFADSNDVKRRNRYSGGEFLVGSPVSQGHVQQPPAGGQAEAMRKSGDWSYVSFPSSKSPPVTPKLTSKRPLSLMQNHHQPISLLETKVMASIIHNNSQRGGHHEVRIYDDFFCQLF